MNNDSTSVRTVCRNERRRGYRETMKWEKHLGVNWKDKRAVGWYTPHGESCYCFSRH